ncbi:NADH-quinone oxidoreductase subunit M [Nibribacter ruber]|uniref:NADH-quinone oxidoreductase subunit M n=1 Tax=Nibribacter ruber TaxID=2698458 RepID=A0A6P1P457_9BACT|nr:NADH-quinone oxidoreductase subunit M [Nibribacter ruber]QHL89172.1 NADH-quinone oxidoreductase subunit M [Nibribacter ruber]
MTYLLSSLLFVPLVAALVLLFLPSRKTILLKSVSLGATLVELLLSVLLFTQFQGKVSGVAGQAFQWQEKHDWIALQLGGLGQLKIYYWLGVDGLNVSLVLLTGLISVIGILSSWRVTKNLKGYLSLYLLLLGSVMGCFLALDLFLFYLFFEFMLLPMYFLIGIWGGPRREYAAIKFFLYTLVGSVLILLAFIGLYASVMDPAATAAQLRLPAGEASVRQVQALLQSGQLTSGQVVHAFNIPNILEARNFIPGSILHAAAGFSLFGLSARMVAFLAIFLGFVIKLPMVPVHTWLPDAHVEAPTPISVLLASILLKVGGYGLFRIAFPFFPAEAAEMSWWIGLLGVVSILYGGACALAMSDLKKLIAYSSVSHMGFVLLGLAALTPEGWNGALFQLFSHGLISGMLFLIAGVIYDRMHNRDIHRFRGLAMVAPKFTTFVVIAFFASLGLPGFSGFIAELLVLLGAFGSKAGGGNLPRWMALAAAIGLVLSAAYYLWTLQRMFFGRFWLSPDLPKSFVDLTRREMLLLLPLALLILLFGLFPALLLDKSGATVAQYLQLILPTQPTSALLP